MKDQIKKLLTKEEINVIQKLSTPHKVQDFLDKTKFNFGEGEADHMSPRRIFKERKADCFEGALFATLCLTYHGYQNYLIDLKVKKSAKKDCDHTLCIFKINNFWGAVSKTNHSVLRWRDPIYKNFRELSMSYFHEYFLDSGEKTLFSFSKPFNIFKKFGTDWILGSGNLDEIAEALDTSPHLPFVPKENQRYIRFAGSTEIKGAAVTEW